MIKPNCLAKYLLTALLLTLACLSWAEPQNLGKLEETIKQYHDSGDYQKDISKVIADAKTYMLQRVRENALKKNPAKLAIVLDIDETSLSNYDSMLERHFGGTKEQFTQQTLAGNGKVIPETLALYNEAKRRGVFVFFVTGRRESERQATESNLSKAGFHQWTGLYLQADDAHDASIIPFKSQMRAKIKANGYTIIESIGDQHSDLQGGYAENVFKIPNPYYFLS